MNPRIKVTIALTLLLVGNSIISFSTSYVVKKEELREYFTIQTNRNDILTDTLFTEGNGSESNPYRISDVLLLQNMSQNMSAHYLLVCDIDASSTRGWNGGNGFDPIGKKYDTFGGNLDGQGYNITGLFIDHSGNDVGMFGCMDQNGFVSMPNVSISKEMVDMIYNAKLYEANITVNNATKQMVRETLQLQ